MDFCLKMSALKTALKSLHEYPNNSPMYPPTSANMDSAEYPNELV